MSPRGPSPDDVAVIVTTYNREDALEAVFESLFAQDCSGFEIVIADDGSGPATRELVESFAGRASAAIRHAWQPDEGYRLARSRNNGVAETDRTYLIFLDGDCVVRDDFVRSHLRLAAPGWFVRGTRILIGEALTDEILSNRLPCHRWGFLRWWFELLRGRINRVSPLARLPLGPLRERGPAKWRGVKGCNFSVWRSDVDRVGGFDEAYEGYEHEDVDLAIRLIRAGVRRKNGRYASPVLHLWHPASDPSVGNVELLRRLLDDGPAGVGG